MLDETKVQEVKDYLIGTSKSEEEAIEACNLSDDVEVLDYIVQAGISACVQCGWWYEDDEMIELNSEFHCEDCAKDNGYEPED